MKTFPLNSRSKTTALKQPKELFTYYRDIDNQYIYDKETVQSNASYYYLPDSDVSKRIDLQSGYSKFQKIPEEQNLGDFGLLLQGIQRYEEAHDGTKLAVDVVTFRGLMTKLLCIPYNNRDAVDLNIVAYDGQLFIKADDIIETNRRQDDLRQKQSQGREQAEYISKCEYSGYKFEAVATLSKPWAESSRLTIEKRGKKIVNNYEQYLSVIRTGIGKTKMALAGEVDCVWDYIPDSPSEVLGHYVELKTSKVLDGPKQAATFERKLFKTWAQCFLMGIRKVVYGFRDDQFLLQAVEVFDTEQIPVMIKNESKINCINALKWYGAVIDWIVSEVPRDDESKAWRVSYDPGSRLFSLMELMAPDNERLRNGEILTDEFKAWRESIKQSQQ
ncbi:RAI1-domain-containing protein [Suhomyces tanzawaensis NRRL Y-17324]|uniref:Decapping nuclease n=1 Tax=Suhomyces tanzawaensis NRRL Y-17324 TaxID=984487 RepID=A0A1E4SGZ7_9ASCO|nr:RAI1-domain-containing protein [Suhomyces tanzawaensis NRRL Y-17324]ODV78778.1 RAI1-domain-containing protein [Suhomyces tanzawaensis NRRL Y-17324]